MEFHLKPTADQPDEAPPFLGTWPRVYTAVAVYLVLLISALYWLTRAFAPGQSH